MVLALLLVLAQAVSGITGVVKDTNGQVIVGASVSVRTPSGGLQQTVTDGDGRFVIANAPDGAATLVVKAPGFADAQQAVTAGEMEVVLAPASVLETVIVSATRTERRLGTVPASVNVVTSETIKASPAVVADDVLRQVPSFSLFRRTSSLAAQPTTQGVSLRGIGPSGQSRTLVLLDGVPFNDPFGGWVYWTRVPLLSVDQIEITEDTASSLYGNIAMGGVINVLTSRPARRTAQLQTQYGNRSTPKVDFFVSDRWRRVGLAVEGSALDTKGFPIVAARERGPIDNNADVEYANVTAKLEFDPTDRLHTFVRVGRFAENRTNAKVGEVNDTVWGSASAGAQAQLPDNSTLQTHVFADRQRSHFNFLAVTNAATTRNVVRLATDQKVPTNGVGGMVQWTKVLGSTQVLSAGADMRWVDGDSEEDAYVA
ncbi:MAG: TonB-dependent receptor plug domain-containing protein, partial [Acidobacteria bacterium]|nr:TonB-dependent receptor plug domain-containing protein [Acidobacteriota bacterium]